MRIAIVTEWLERVGGIEAYLEGLLAGLAGRHSLGFWAASSGVGQKGAILLPPGVEHLSAAPGEDAVGRLQAFAPDVLFAHGLDDPILEARVLGLAPAVAVEHTYHGTCISGSKTMSWPRIRACDRRFGPACLALYLPRRCGGRSPLTMLRMYRMQAARLATLGRCAAVVTFSRHMREELLRHRLPPERVQVVPPFVAPGDEPLAARADDGVTRLLFLGRLETLKGPSRLIDALPLVARQLGRPVVLTIAGDGTDRAALTAQARAREREDPRVTVHFAGWQASAERRRLLSATDAIVVPSLLPEPFGLVGLEAGIAGVPAVAFAVGGIVDWLKDDETGCLASAEGGRPEALAEAIVRCTGDRVVRARLASAARRSAAAWTLERHVAAIEGVLAGACRRLPGRVH